MKDLNILGRELSNTVIVDNTLHAFTYQIENGILIKTYEGNKTDRALTNLAAFLLHIKDAKDLRTALFKSIA